ncbi:MAG: phage tail tape measure protein, partial [Actinobacteria bacterium]|nr:phage tail tape measure protein [Actinomycetota bacterium]
GRVNDALVATFQNTNTNVAQLGEAMSYVAPVAASAGLEFEEVAAAIGLMGNAGIQGSRAGTALTGSITRLLSPTSAMQEIIEQLGLDVLDTDGNLRSLTEIVEQLESSGASTADIMQLFGQRAGPAMAALISEGSGALKEQLQANLESSGLAAEVADTQMEGLNGAMARLKSALEGVAIAIAESGILDWAADLADRAANLFSRLSESNPALLRLGTIIAGVLAAAGPVLFIVGSGLRAIGLALTPGGLLLAGLGLLAAGFVYAFGEGDTFGQKIVDIGEKIREKLAPAFDFIRGVLAAFGVASPSASPTVASGVPCSV